MVEYGFVVAESRVKIFFVTLTLTLYAILLLILFEIATLLMALFFICLAGLI
jgi:hypothetical protein